MRHALALAARALGTTAPNPAVGCVIVGRDGRIVGRGWTSAGGRPHAETMALAAAGPDARGATAYVSLEPCAHHGQTPPCAQALIDAGVARVLAAVEDPDSRVCGKWLARLRDAGIAVELGLFGREAADLNAGFFLRVTAGRPLVTLKIAQSADGRTASSSGESRWITGEQARLCGHLMRARHDAILVGIETALADDPALTCRVAGLEARSPLRIVLDSRLRLTAQSCLARTAREYPTLVFTAVEPHASLLDLGVDIVRVATDSHGRLELCAILDILAGKGVTRLLVEGGARIHAGFLGAGLVDRIEAFSAPLLLGAAGHPAIGALGATGLADAPRLVRRASRLLGPDRLESFAVSA
jgi:diaminohydroxyphosphoribosylaminopyrimidine deaminase/5-amino-6-(5-phosphoribosylamino)uracil reductase